MGIKQTGRLFGGLFVSVVLVLGSVACGDRHAGGELDPVTPIDTVYGEVPPFQLVDQSGEVLSSEQLKGKVWAVGFIFTRCPSICPVLTALMKEVEMKSSDLGSDFQLVSFSVDPSYDTPEILQAYAGKHGANLERWTFLTGEPGAVEKTVVEGLKISMGRSSVDEDIVDVDAVFHGTKALLIDQEMKIRGYYALEDRGGFGQPSAVEKMVADATRLRGAKTSP
jgi:protein SCO1/2